MDSKIKILVIGSGGREHALCWKLHQSPLTEKIFCIPGNAGIAAIAECAQIEQTPEKLAKFAKENNIGLCIVGPEQPLCDGIVDEFLSQGLKIFGPDKSSARLEGSKAFAKYFMEKYGIPTAKAEVFETIDSASRYVKDIFASGAKGAVVKADGLAAGKGVIVANSLEMALKGLEQCFSGKFGAAGKKVLVEEMLIGEEASILALTDGETIIPLASSQDHKRAGDGDTGPNTGGMGAYSPAPVVDQKIMNIVETKILKPFLRGLKEEKLYYRGIIYAGVMISGEEVKVLEFNVRFGDPETQVVLPRLESDFVDIILATVEGRLKEKKLAWSPECAVCVVMASGGYPGSYSKGFEISGIEDAEKEGAIVFHAGTTFKNDKLVNSGGRVLGVTALAPTISAAISKAYHAVGKISWQDAYFRKDIGHRALRR